MKKDIQPNYKPVEVRCACGNTFIAGSTKDEIRVEICSECHPFYTGKQKNIEKGGRIDKFKKDSTWNKNNRHISYQKAGVYMFSIIFEDI